MDDACHVWYQLYIMNPLCLTVAILLKLGYFWCNKLTQGYKHPMWHELQERENYGMDFDDSTEIFVEKTEKGGWLKRVRGLACFQCGVIVDETQSLDDRKNRFSDPRRLQKSCCRLMQWTSSVYMAEFHRIKRHLGIVRAPLLHSASRGDLCFQARAPSALGRYLARNMSPTTSPHSIFPFLRDGLSCFTPRGVSTGALDYSKSLLAKFWVLSSRILALEIQYLSVQREPGLLLFFLPWFSPSCLPCSWKA